MLNTLKFQNSINVTKDRTVNKLNIILFQFCGWISFAFSCVHLKKTTQQWVIYWFMPWTLFMIADLECIIDTCVPFKISFVISFELMRLENSIWMHPLLMAECHSAYRIWATPKPNPFQVAMIIFPQSKGRTQRLFLSLLPGYVISKTSCMLPWYMTMAVPSGCNCKSSQTGDQLM